MADRQRFQRSLTDADLYPKNLIAAGRPDYALKTYKTKLDERVRNPRTQLFSHDERTTKLELWQRHAQNHDFVSILMSNCYDTKAKVRRSLNEGHHDPICRFIFLSASHSRNPLRTTREMFTECLSYHQVMPEFLDFIFPFGKQVYRKDFHFGGLRHQGRFSGVDRGLSIDILGRSGLAVELCYSLESVEFLSGRPGADIPWSIRRTSTHCSFDIENGRTVWIIAKGNDVVRNRIVESTTGSFPLAESRSLGPMQSFHDFLSTHLLLCDWSGESWRWYIDWLEDRVQSHTRQAFSPNAIDPLYDSIATRAATLDESPPQSPRPTRRDTMKSMVVKAAPMARIRRVFANTNNSRSDTEDHELQQAATLEPSIEKDDPLDSLHPLFEPSDLQDVQFLEEQVNEAKMVVKINISTLRSLTQYFAGLVKRSDCPDMLRAICNEELPRFARRVDDMIEEGEMHMLRLEALLQIVLNRKALLYGILESRNMRTNQRLAIQAQQSAETMTAMTKEMQDIAHKTELETVSMRIITLVTLFFLPGTFISTLMSTDIVRFTRQDNGEVQRTYSSAALILYMKICIPMMAVTFVAWYGVYQWTKSREQRQRLRRKLFPDSEDHV